MKNKHKHPNMSKIWLLVAPSFLQEFDTETNNTYSSRNEAIRRGIKLILDEIANTKTPNPQQILNQKPP
ncbi:MAG: hypothetical protein FWC33_00560, partial [Candidatus Bathyarchaeota archaeon]|nr:hypothetical protein [Candidatus Termiticorpusculum sp.]